MSNLAKTVANRLSAGALVLVIQEADEALAVAAAEAGSAAWDPIKIVSASDPEVAQVLDAH